jgi:co-chaperonin GroES (HSP10)
MKDKVPNLEDVRCVNGVVLIEPVEEEGRIDYGGEKGRIGMGKVINFGGAIANKDGSEKHCPARKGELVYFLTYEGGYDKVVIDGKAYIFAMFDDLRGIVK